MQIFTTLLLKLIPLYILIGLGYIAGRFLHAKKETVASLLLYIIAPVVVFYGALTTPLTVGILSLPVLYFSLATILCFTFLKLAGYVWKDATKNILAFAAGSSNTGYFGLPVILSLFGQEMLSIAVLIILGVLFYENSVGFFVTARGHHTIEESLSRLARLPTIYAFLIGLCLNAIGLKPDIGFVEIINNFRGAYTVLGMMLIGLGLSNIVSFSIDWTFIGLSFLAKFFISPFLIGAVIYFDTILFHIYPETIHKVMFVMSIVPLAGNLVAFATELKTHPEKTAIAVLLSTLFALVYIPIMIAVFV